MSNFLNNPNSEAGLHAEKMCAIHLANLFQENNVPAIVVHSICSDDQYHEAPGLICWKDSVARNSQLGDIRIYKKDENGRPIQNACVCIDVKYSKDWEFGSITFKKRSESPKQDAMLHLFGWVGRGVSDQFWYLSYGKSAKILIPLINVRAFVYSCTEEEMLKICKKTKYDGVDSWYFSLGEVKSHLIPLDEWALTYVRGIIEH